MIIPLVARNHYYIAGPAQSQKIEIAQHEDQDPGIEIRENEEMAVEKRERMKRKKKNDRKVDRLGFQGY